MTGKPDGASIGDAQSPATARRSSREKEDAATPKADGAGRKGMVQAESGEDSGALEVSKGRTEAKAAGKEAFSFTGLNFVRWSRYSGITHPS